MKTILITICTVVLFGFGVMLLHGTPLQRPPKPEAAAPAPASTPIVGTPTPTPSVITVNTPTTVTITAPITGSTPLANGVNLLRLGVTGTQPTILGVMHDDGKNGDAVAGDGVYTLQVTFNETTIGQIQLQVSSAFSNRVRRLTSSAASLNVQGLLITDTLDLNDIVVLGTISNIVSNFGNQSGRIFTYYTLSPTLLIKGSVPDPIVVEVPGGTVGTTTQVVSLYPSFSSGQRVVLFLSRTSNSFYHIPFGVLGAFGIERNAQGTDLAVIAGGVDFSRLDMTTPLDPTYADLLSRSAAHQLTLSELLGVLK